MEVNYSVLQRQQELAFHGKKIEKYLSFNKGHRPLEESKGHVVVGCVI